MKENYLINRYCFPHIALAYNTKGQALFNLKKYSEALTCYEKAMDYDLNTLKHYITKV